MLCRIVLMVLVFLVSEAFPQTDSTKIPILPTEQFSPTEHFLNTEQLLPTEQFSPAEQLLHIEQPSLFRRERDSSALFPPTLLSTVDYKPKLPGPDYFLLGSLSTAYVGAFVGVHIYQKNAWWSGKKTGFHIENDWKYALSVDKLGHFYSPVILAHAFSVGLEAANVDYGTGIWVSSAAALLFQLYVEVYDGFASEWGFSPGDAIADIAGAAYPVLQYYYPVLYNFHPRFSYWPVGLGNEGHNPGQKLILVDDYEGQRFWLSMRVGNLFGDGFKKIWPDFLMLSVGYGVRNLDGRGGGLKDFYIALDLDYDKIPLYGKFWQMLKNSFAFIKFPMPAVRVTNGVAFFGFAF
ncbi:MAG: YfiM family protein [Ignavibacteriales bacterium]|nr:MAG: DUF2279 domain-containing protein [Ignavibacteriaceae bacterium]MBV6445507.1 hypothetical protein [Ignavibacteriaceae bacterium]MCZ2142629.1 YfiM family protein [Ignavibacteriales bacterium]WKZ73227.1 MAG: DUF2279 domain-containing protein [Ignavibacteriaceae bacterium]